MIPVTRKGKIATINEWAQFDISYDATPQYALAEAFLQGTSTRLFNKDGTTTTGSDLFFQNIYVPIKVIDQQGMAEEFHFYNVGFKPVEMADAYQTLYGFNALSVPFDPTSIGNATISTGILAQKIAAIFQMNKQKYYKMIELQGYTYNPLWNVDGTEIRQSLANEGINDVDTNSFSSGRGTTANYNQTEHQTTPYDDDTYRKEYKDTTQGQASVSNFPQYAWNGTQWVVTQDSMSNVGAESMTKAGGRTSTVYVHNNAKNLENGQQVDYVVDVTDTAFGQALVGGDKMHLEKYVRQGNIGVTKTQELIEAERQNLRFSVVQEFFDDVNKQLLVGIF